MKTNKGVYVGICLLFVAPILFAEDYKKEIPVEDAMKYYCITWINPAYNESSKWTGKKTMNKDGKFEWYSNETSESTTWDGTFKIEKSWIDKDGNVWLNIIYRIWGATKYTVAKISDDGNTLEQIYSYAAYPTEVDPNDSTYFIMYKK